MKFRKGDKVEFRVRRGEHNLLAGRPGEVVGRRGRHLVVRCRRSAQSSPSRSTSCRKRTCGKRPDRLRKENRNDYSETSVRLLAR